MARKMAFNVKLYSRFQFLCKGVFGVVVLAMSACANRNTNESALPVPALNPVKHPLLVRGSQFTMRPVTVLLFVRGDGLSEKSNISMLSKFTRPVCIAWIVSCHRTNERLNFLAVTSFGLTLSLSEESNLAGQICSVTGFPDLFWKRVEGNELFESILSAGQAFRPFMDRYSSRAALTYIILRDQVRAELAGNYIKEFRHFSIDFCCRIFDSEWIGWHIEQCIYHLFVSGDYRLVVPLLSALDQYIIRVRELDISDSIDLNRFLELRDILRLTQASLVSREDFDTLRATTSRRNLALEFLKRSISMPRFNLPEAIQLRRAFQPEILQEESRIYGKQRCLMLDGVYGTFSSLSELSMMARSLEMQLLPMIPLGADYDGVLLSPPYSTLFYKPDPTVIDSTCWPLDPWVLLLSVGKHGLNLEYSELVEILRDMPDLISFRGLSVKLSLQSKFMGGDKVLQQFSDGTIFSRRTVLD